MMRFIYVFHKSTKDKMLSKGYRLLKSDDKNELYVFENRDDLKFDLDELEFILSNVITF